MSDLMKSMQAASSGMAVQAARLRINTENMANADTPGYRRKMVTFQEAFAQDKKGSVETGRMILDKSDLTEIYDPSHPLANSEGIYEGSNVNIIVEIADAREAQRSYEANLKMFDQARQMTSSMIELLRR